MAKLDRVLMREFASDAPTSEVGQFGSLAAGAANTTKDLDTIQSLAQFLGGLFDVTNNAAEPPRIEDINGLYYLIIQQIRYLFQNGIPEWISTEKYYAGVSYVAVNGVLYKAILGDDGANNNTNKNPVTETLWWEVAFSNYLRSDVADTAEGLITFASGLTSLGTTKFGDGTGAATTTMDTLSTQFGLQKFNKGGSTRWQWVHGNSDIANLSLQRFNSSGVLVDVPIVFNFDNGNLNIANNVTLENTKQLTFAGPSSGTGSIRMDALNTFTLKTNGNGFEIENASSVKSFGVDESGNVAVVGDADIAGVLTVNDFVQAVGESVLNGAITGSSLYSLFTPYVPNIGDKMQCNGSVKGVTSGKQIVISHVERDTPTGVIIYGFDIGVTVNGLGLGPTDTTFYNVNISY